METTKETEKAVAARRRVEDGPAWKRVAAYVVLSPAPRHEKGYGIIRCAYPKDGMGPLHVFIWDTKGGEIQYRSVRGCGYNKLDAAMDGAMWDGVKIGGNWKAELYKRGYEVIQAL